MFVELTSVQTSIDYSRKLLIKEVSSDKTKTTLTRHI